MYDKILSARETLRGRAHYTPVMTSRTLNEIVGAQVYLKCENLQRVGAFKFRGAFNAMSRLSDKQKTRGVLTFSSGNHAQAIAMAGSMLNIKTTVVMPTNAPEIKTATSGYGATIVTYDPQTSTREQVAQSLMKNEEFVLIPPFDHQDVIAGQGTAVLELFEQVGPMDLVLTPCGGGGLLSGSAIAAKGAHASCRVIGIEPELADDATRSFKTGILQTVTNPPTIADGVRTHSLGNLTFPLIQQYVDDMVCVTEKSIIEAVNFLFFRMKLVVEPAGALGVAALLSQAVRATGSIGIVISGGNIDGKTMGEILDFEELEQERGPYVH